MDVDILIKNANELVTLAGPTRPRIKYEMNELSIIRKGSIAIKDGKIVDIGNVDEYKADQTIDASGKTVIPGFIDPHTHLAFYGYREFELDMKLRGSTYQEITKKGGGINYTVRLTRDASKESIKEETKKRLDRMLEYGTTTCEAKSGYGLNIKNEIKLLEVYRELNHEHPIDIVPTFLGAHAFPEEYKDDKNGYVSDIIYNMIPEISSRKLARFCDVFLDKGFFDRNQAKKILDAGKKHGLIPKIHADELSDSGGAALASEIDALTADHLLNISDEGIKSMAKNGTIGVLLPATVFSLMKKEYAPARRLIESGVPIALATDLNPNCYTENMQFVIQLACYYMKMTPAEALTAATVNAAYSIGEGNKRGTLEAEKQADVLILDAPSYKFIPYHFGVNLVEKVIKNGKMVIDFS